MEYIYAVTTEEEIAVLRKFANNYSDAVDKYVSYLEKEFNAEDFPGSIVLTSYEIACNRISDIRVPAYTNDYRIVFCPAINTWRELYLKQLDGYGVEETIKIRDYYSSKLNEHNLLQILGHELAHHISLFTDDAYDNGGAWFEEGMVEYISRKYFLSDEEYKFQKEINMEIVGLYEMAHGERPLSDFGKYADDNDLATVYYDYWKAFLEIDRIVQARNGDILSVLHEGITGEYAANT